MVERCSSESTRRGRRFRVLRFDLKAERGLLSRMTVRDLYMHDASGTLGGARTRLDVTNVTVTRQLDNPNAATGGQVAVAAYQVTGTNLTVTDNIGFGMYSYIVVPS